MPTFEEEARDLWAAYGEATNKDGLNQNDLDQLFDQYVKDREALRLKFNHPSGPIPRRKPK